MDVFICGQWREVAGGDVSSQLVKAREHGVKVSVREQPSSMQYLGVGFGCQHVVGCQHPVEMRGHAERKHGIGGSACETSAPQGTFVCSVTVHLLCLAVAAAGNLGGQAMEFHESLGQSLVEGVAGVVGGQVEVVE